MKFNLQPSIFGSPLRTRILVLTALLERTYPLQLAGLLKVSPTAVRTAVDRLERDRLVATRMWGKTRMITLDPTMPYGRELKDLLVKFGASLPEYDEMVRSLRTRPRRRGKPLLKSDPAEAARARTLAQRRP